jgi:hypothetical protein
MRTMSRELLIRSGFLCAGVVLGGAGVWFGSGKGAASDPHRARNRSDPSPASAGAREALQQPGVACDAHEVARQVVRALERHPAGQCAVAAASASSGAGASAPDPEQGNWANATRAQDLIDEAAAARRWTDKDRQELRNLISDMPDSERSRLLLYLAQRVNADEIQPKDGLPPL